MLILTDLKKFVPDPKRPLILALGNFDGVHRAHHQLLERVRAGAKQHNGIAAALTFQEHPQHILHPASKPPLLTSIEHKLFLLRELELHLVFLIPFTAEFAHIEPEDFVENTLVKTLGVKEVFLGYNAHFGHNRQGNTQVMARLARKFGFHFEQLAPVKIGGEFVSSTQIRTLIQAGELLKAEKFLGRPFSIIGKVIHGAGRGHSFGFPTANMKPSSEILPPEGVYPVHVRLIETRRNPGPGNAYENFEVALQSPWFAGVLNYGRRPSIENDSHEPLLEAFVFDYEGDLYGKTLEIIFYPHLRDEIKFSDPSALKDQIRKDIQTAKKFLAVTPPPLSAKITC